MANIKPSFDGRGMYSEFYDGPPPTPGPYKGNIVGMWLSTVQSGANEGAYKILVSVEINHGKFKGARLLNNLTLVKNSAWVVNQFLHALTPDGTEKQKKIMEDLFWEKGFRTDSDNEHKLGTPIINFGGKFKPIGKEISFVTKFDTYGGEKRAVIDRFVVPTEMSDDDGDDEAEDVEETVEEEPETVEAQDNSSDDADDDGDDDDDPWD